MKFFKIFADDPDNVNVFLKKLDFRYSQKANGCSRKDTVCLKGILGVSEQNVCYHFVFKTSNAQYSRVLSGERYYFPNDDIMEIIQECSNTHEEIDENTYEKMKKIFVDADNTYKNELNLLEKQKHTLFENYLDKLDSDINSYYKN